MRALAEAASRELLWGLRLVAGEVEAWRARAACIPDAVIRNDALTALARKRANVDGAALFWTLPRSRRPVLAQLLASYQIMWDFLDCASERGANAGQHNGRQLHQALCQALDSHAPVSNHYRHHLADGDGCYLRCLVQACRERFGLLPSHHHVQPLLLREALRANVQAINHDPNPQRRDASLREWCAREYPESHEASWYELTGAAGAGISIYALLALASETHRIETNIEPTYNAYFPWACAVATMLDSYVDHLEDAANGDHLYISHYPTRERAIEGISLLIRRTLVEVQALPRGERHVVIATCMVAMYLSKSSAGQAATRPATVRLTRTGGSMTRMLLPILRLWRMIYRQRTA